MSMIIGKSVDVEAYDKDGNKLENVCILINKNKCCNLLSFKALKTIRFTPPV